MFELKEPSDGSLGTLLHFRGCICRDAVALSATTCLMVRHQRYRLRPSFRSFRAEAFHSQAKPKIVAPVRMAGIYS